MKAMARVTLQGSNLDLADSTNRLQPLDKVSNGLTMSIFRGIFEGGNFGLATNAHLNSEKACFPYACVAFFSLFGGLPLRTWKTIDV